MLHETKWRITYEAALFTENGVFCLFERKLKMNLNSEDVDFDFFDTPREIERESLKSKPSSFDSKPPNAYRSKHDSDGKFTEQRSSYRNESVNARSSKGGVKSRYSDDSFSDSSSASDTPRNVKQSRAPIKIVQQKGDIQRTILACQKVQVPIPIQNTHLMRKTEA